MEQGKEPVQAPRCRVLNLLVEQRKADGVATGELDQHLVQDVGDEVVPRPLRLLLAGLHRFARLEAVVAGRRLLSLERGGGVVTGDGLLQLLGHLLGSVSVDDSHRVARRASIVED
jgi:hypothetical protein